MIELTALPFALSDMVADATAIDASARMLNGAIWIQSLTARDADGVIGLHGRNQR